jgi:hypothetical protein
MAGGAIRLILAANRTAHLLNGICVLQELPDSLTSTSKRNFAVWT